MFLTNKKAKPKFKDKLESEKAIFYKRQLYYCRLLSQKTLGEFSEITNLPISTISCCERNKTILTQKNIEKVESLLLSDQLEIYNFGLFENKIEYLIDSLVMVRKPNNILVDDKDYDILNNAIFKSFAYLSDLKISSALLNLINIDYTKPGFSNKYYAVYQLLTAISLFASGNVYACSQLLENRVSTAEDKRVEMLFRLLKIMTKFSEKKPIYTNEIDELEIYFSALNSNKLSGVLEAIRLIQNLKYEDKQTFENDLKNILKCKFNCNKKIGNFFILFAQIYHGVFISDLFFNNYIKFENSFIRLFFETMYFIAERKIDGITHNINEFLKHKIPSGFLISKLIELAQKLILYKDLPDAFIKYFLDFLDSEISPIWQTFFVLLVSKFFQNTKGGSIVLKLIKLDEKVKKIIPQPE